MFQRRVAWVLLGSWLVACSASDGAVDASADGGDDAGLNDVGLSDARDSSPERGCDGWGGSPHACCPEVWPNTGGCNECYCSCGGGTCDWQCTQIGCDTRGDGPYPFSQVWLNETKPLTTVPYDLGAFVPDFCTSTDPERSQDLGAYTLDCPALLELWPCSLFVEPPFAPALQPAGDLLLMESRVGEDPDQPAGCVCEQGIWTYEVDAGEIRYCRALIELQGDEPVLIDSPKALAARFAPVESAIEALAFATLVAPGTSAGETMRHIFKTDALSQVPLQDASSELICVDLGISGTSVTKYNDGQSTWWGVHTFAVGTTCAKGGLTALEIRVTPEGVVTLESSEKFCWYEELPCVD